MILIATSCPDKLGRWERALEGFATTLTVHKVDSLREGLAQMGPTILLLDFDLPGLGGQTGVAALGKVSPTTKIIVLTGQISDETELALFKVGVRGCCRSDIEPQLLKRIVAAVLQGELWIRRAITPRLLEDLGARLHDEGLEKRIIVGRLTELTRREREIALLIGDGESNKQIARQLAITERTVKAHLTGIFRKLGIADRLKLALEVRSQPGGRSEQTH